MDGCDVFGGQIGIRSVDLKEAAHVNGGTFVRVGHRAVRTTHVGLLIVCYIPKIIYIKHKSLF